MRRFNLRERLRAQRPAERRPRRAAYALPTLFTAGNVFLGYISVMQSIQGAMVAASGGAGAISRTHLHVPILPGGAQF